jgi:DNA-binding response OmpR family regulator
LICDLMMPWADGFEVLANLGPAKPKVIVLTARDDDYSEERAMSFGIDAYITKPYDPDVLLETVRELVS